MHVQSSTAFGRIASPLAAASLRAMSRLESAAPARATDASTHVSLGATPGNSATYGVARGASNEPLRFWAGPHDGALAEQMLRNSGARAVTLSDRWRGLGGALLRELAETGKGTSQTLAEIPAPPAEATSDTLATDDAAAIDGTAASTSEPDAAAAADAAKLEADALAGVANNAVKVSLTITTRSGQKVELQIGVNNGRHEGTRGLQVQISSSGELSDAERDALAAMAGGLDQALEGLGRGEPRIDLAQLKQFSSSGELSGLDLAIENPNTEGQPKKMSAFSLHLDQGQAALSLKRGEGEQASEMSLSAIATAPGALNGDQRRSAVESMLKQIDEAAERRHADKSMVSLFKEAFKQLQALSADGEEDVDGHDADADDDATDSPQPAMQPQEQSQVQALESGLADFDASFSGPSEKRNRLGCVVEHADVNYRIGQSTSVNEKGGAGERSIQQTKTESLDASIFKSRTLLLDMDSGNYDATNIQDRKTVSTLIETSQAAVTRALRKTDEHRLSEFASLERDRVTASSRSPLDRNFIERLR